VGGLLQTDPQERAKTTTASSDFFGDLVPVWSVAAVPIFFPKKKEMKMRPSEAPEFLAVKGKLLEIRANLA